MKGGSFLATTPFVLMQTVSPLPYMSVPRRKLIRALNAITAAKKNGRNTSTSYRLHLTDLGSGDGELVLAAAENGWRSTGVELNPTLWAISSFRRFRLPQEARMRCSLVLGDMWGQDISHSDAVMIFGVKPIMADIVGKINREAREGTYVLSYRFPLPTQTASSPQRFYTESFYDHVEMRVYRNSIDNVSNFVIDS
mmetsp:Transcript_31650/g.38444  ORF Transcript_31650/g.38444 Transcript_31650/m.38444 type:complete len:196 (-) Transcript_31650:65-652(-)